MNRKIKYSLLISVMVFMSCQKFLEPKSQSEYVPKEIQSLDELLVGDAYFSPLDYQPFQLYTVLGLFDDDVATRPDLNKLENNSEGDFNQALLAFSWSKDMLTQLSGFGNMYTSAYKLIMGCNAVLDYMDDVIGTPEEKNDVKAQALALRSFYYFHLVNIYGKPYSADKNALGVPLKLTSKLSTEDIPRSTVGNVYKQIEEDLLEAERLIKTLPEETQCRKNKRVNLPFIQLLLSRVYLYMENWKEALKYGEIVARDYSYKVRDLNEIKEPSRYAYPSYPNYYTWENPEMVFMLGDLKDGISLALTQIRVERIVEGENQPRTIRVCVASEELIKSFDEADLRKTRYLVWEDLSEYEASPKYRIATNKMEVGSDYKFNTGWGKDWGIAFKVTEAYLNAAEAAAVLYKTEGEASYLNKALDLLNDLRVKRFPSGQYNDLTPASVGDLVEFVRAERRRELCFEHHRWFDLRRYGMEELRHVWYDRDHNPIEYVLEKNDPGFTLLLPNTAFDRNHALIQNEVRTK